MITFVHLNLRPVLWKQQWFSTLHGVHLHLSLEGQTKPQTRIPPKTTYECLNSALMTSRSSSPTSLNVLISAPPDIHPGRLLLRVSHRSPRLPEHFIRVHRPQLRHRLRIRRYKAQSMALAEHPAAVWRVGEGGSATASGPEP
jgi:hypothetical protein